MPYHTEQKMNQPKIIFLKKCFSNTSVVKKQEISKMILQKLIRVQQGIKPELCNKWS